MLLPPPPSSKPAGDLAGTTERVLTLFVPLCWIALGEVLPYLSQSAMRSAKRSMIPLSKLVPSPQVHVLQSRRNWMLNVSGTFHSLRSGSSKANSTMPPSAKTSEPKVS